MTVFVGHNDSEEVVETDAGLCASIQHRADGLIADSLQKSADVSKVSPEAGCNQAVTRRAAPSCVFLPLCGTTPQLDPIRAGKRRMLLSGEV